MDKIERNDLLIAREVSVYLRIPLRTIYYLSKTGKVKAVKIGKQWRYNKSDIENCLSSGTDFSKEPIRKPEGFTERRACQRINCNFRCRYSVNLQPFRDINSEGIIKNISAGGVLLFTKDGDEDIVEVDDPVELNFTANLYNCQELKVSAIGKVIRKVNRRLGIKFLDISDYIRGRINEYTG